MMERKPGQEGGKEVILDVDARCRVRRYSCTTHPISNLLEQRLQVLCRGDLIRSCQFTRGRTLDLLCESA
jgi:hypothetical protein